MSDNIKKYIKILIPIIVILIVLIGGTYAWLTLTKVGDKVNVLRAGTLSMSLEDCDEALVLENAVPESDQKGLTEKVCTFRLNNRGKTASDYTIYLDDVALETDKTRMQDKYIKYSVTKNSSDEDPTILTETGANPNRTLDLGKIDAGETNTYTLKVWIDSEADNAVMGTVFAGVLRVETTQSIKHTVTIDPNGGMYEESKELKTVTLKTGETMEVGVPTREAYEFEGWDVSEENALIGSLLTVGKTSVVLTAKWKASADAVAKINNDYYTSLEKALDKAQSSGDTIVMLKDTTETVTNTKDVTIDLNGRTVTGKNDTTITNNGTLNIINEGTIENTKKTAIVNNNHLILGTNDESVSKIKPAIEGTSYGIEQNDTFDFYDGVIEAKVGVTGGYNDIPVDYYVYVDHNDEKNYQKIYLTETLTKAVVKTIEGTKVYYFNLQDAINTVAINNMSLYAIRDFEAAYTLTINEGNDITLDIKGFNVTTGYTITNNGNLTILDSGKDETLEKGKLSPSVSITNNNELTFKDITVEESTDANIVENSGNLVLRNSTLIGKKGYALKTMSATNTTDFDDDSTLKSTSQFAVYNTKDTNLIIENGNIYGISEYGNVTINGGIIYNYTYSIENEESGNLTINGGLIDGTKTSNYAIYNNGILTMNDGTIKGPTAISAYYSKEVTINGGTITGTSNYGISTSDQLTINGGTIIGKSYGVYLQSRYGGAASLNMTGGYVEGESGIYNYTYMSMSGGTIIGNTKYGIEAYCGGTNVKSGTIEGKIYGIYLSYNSGSTAINIGQNDSETNVNNPIILGESYGVYNNGGTVNFYDGILKGQVAGYNGTINKTADGTEITTSSEIIDETTYTTNYLIEYKYFAQVGDKQFNSLNKAINSVDDEGTIEIIDDATIKSDTTIPPDKNITLDLNGYMLTTSGTITNNGTFTLKDSSLSQDGTINSNYSERYGYVITSNGPLNIESGNIKSNDTENSIQILKSNGTANITGGKFYGNDGGLTLSGNTTIENIDINTKNETIKNYSTTVINGGIYVSRTNNTISNGSNLTINDGEISTLTTNTSEYSSSAIYDNDGTITINGGTITGKRGITIYGTTTVNGGEITGEICGVLSRANYYGHVGNLIVNGGTITGTNNGIVNGNTTTINGGTIISTAGNALYMDGTVTIKDGELNGYINGIYANSGTLNLGNSSDSIDITKPVVVGNNDGLYVNSTNVNLYDGIYKGKTEGITGTISNMPDEYTVASGEEEIQGELYKTNYLGDKQDFLKVGENTYNTFAKALASISTEGTIELIEDANVSSSTTIPSGKTITFDMNGHILTTTQTITNNGSLTLTDSSEGQTGKITTPKQITLISNTNNIVLESGTLNYTGSSLYYTIIQSSKSVVINGGNIITNGTALAPSKGTLVFNNGTIQAKYDAIDVSEGTIVTINDGLIESTTGSGIDTWKSTINMNGGTLKGSNYGIYNYGTTNVNGGEIIGTNGIGVSQYDGTTNVYDGKVIGQNGAGISLYQGSTNIKGGIVQGTTYGITGGSINIGTNDEDIYQSAPIVIGKTYAINGTPNFYDGILKGTTGAANGTYSTIATNAEVVESSEIIDDTTYVTNYLQKTTDVVSNNDVKYKNIQTAIDEATSGDTLKLIDNTSAFYSITIPADKSITLDMNNYKMITSKEITNNGVLNIIDSSSDKNGTIETSSAIYVIRNYKELEVSDISLKNEITNYELIRNENNATATLTNLTTNSKVGINNNDKNSIMTINNSNINATSSYAVNNYGNINMNGGTYQGTTYGVYQYNYYSTSEDEDNKYNDVTLKGNYSIYNQLTNNKNIITNSNLNGPTYNNSTSGQLEIKSSNLTSYLRNGSGKMNTDSIEINVSYTSSYNAVVNDGGLLTITNSNLNLKYPSTNSNTVTGYYNNGGTINSKDTNITITSDSKNNIVNAIYNYSPNSTIDFDNGTITIIGGKTSTGLNNYTYATDSNINFKKGTIKVNNAVNSYGAYIDSGTIILGIKDGDGTENATVSTTNPLIEAVGTTTGIGVKKVNGYFKYYDGKLIGSTNAKPDTTTEVEYNYEAEFYIDPLTNYEYCILEYMK